MSQHAPLSRDDAGDRSERNSSARGLLANDEIESLLGPGATFGPTENSNTFTQLTDESIAQVGNNDRRNSLPTDVRSFSLKEFSTVSPSVDLAGLAANSDVQLELRVELGRTYMHLDEVRRLRHGSVVSLDSQADEPVAIYVNNRLIARGELLVMNGTFCVRVLELVAATMAKAG